MTPLSACAWWMRCWASRRAVGELDAGVDAERQRGVGDDVGGDLLAVGAQEREHVGQVELALGVVGGERLERGEEVAAGERVDAGVDLADRLLLGGRVAGLLRLDDALDAAVGRPDDAAVAARVLELHRRHRGRGAALLVRLRERGDRLGGDERHVAVEHEHGVVRADLVGGGAHGVAGAVRLLLDRHLDAVGQRVGELALRPVDDHDAAGAGFARGGDRPLDHRAPADRVKDLGQVRAHAGALARSEDQHGGSGHAEHRSIGVAEPALGGSSNGKTPVFGAGYRGSNPCPPMARCVAVSPAGAGRTTRRSGCSARRRRTRAARGSRTPRRRCSATRR